MREYSDQLSDGQYVLVAKLPLHVNEFEDVQRDFRYVLKRVNAIVVSENDKKPIS